MKASEMFADLKSSQDGVTGELDTLRKSMTESLGRLQDEVAKDRQAIADANGKVAEDEATIALLRQQIASQTATDGEASPELVAQYNELKATIAANRKTIADLEAQVAAKDPTNTAVIPPPVASPATPVVDDVASPGVPEDAAVEPETPPADVVPSPGADPEADPSTGPVQMVRGKKPR